VLTGAGWVIGIGVTVLILATPYLQFGYRSSSLHLVLESVDGLVALLLSYLIHGRSARSHRLQDLLLAQGLLMLAMASLGLAFLGEALAGLGPQTVDVWLPLVLRMAGSLLIAAAALAGGRRVVARVGLQWTPWLVVVPVMLVLWLERHRLPAALDRLPPLSAQHPVIEGHPALLVAQGVGALCFVIASAAFTIQVSGRGDQLLRWLGPSCALAAFARINYELFPSLYSDWFYTGDGLRTLSYLLLLVGAAREIQEYWSAQTRVAVLEDRRRLARELHDGVVQELGYIRLEAHDVAPGLRERIIDACDRGLDEARAAIATLGRGADEPLAVVLHKAARQMVERYGGRLLVDLDQSITASADQRYALVRITREAVSNALRHGRAARVRLRLVSEQGRRVLMLEDDGAGFDVSAPSSGYGLTSMRERALGLPGSFTIDSEPGQGTVVGVAW
jgi:signal transduction histidine kinase